MSQNNAVRSLAYDNPTTVTRVAAQLAANAAGSGALSGKFYAFTQCQLYGVTFAVTTAGTSTYTVGGTATNPAAQFSLIYITNTNTTGTAVSLGTNTIGPFTIGGTGTSTAVGGAQGGIAGGWQGPYAVNTLGGTNTSLVWGTNTFVTTSAAAGQTQVGYPGGQNIGFGGLPLNPGDQVYLVNGTDATVVVVPILQYSVQPINGVILS
jgi:hypothetical protein